MIRAAAFGLVLLAGIAVAAAGADAQQVDPNSDLGKFRTLREQGMKALDANDSSAALTALDGAGAILPDSPSILLLKAQAYLAGNRKDKAHAVLTEYEQRGYIVDLKKNPDLGAAWDSDLDALQKANLAPVGAMHVATSLPGFSLGQALAYGSDGDKLYIAGVRTGAITLVTAAGTKPVVTFRPGVAAYDIGLHDGMIWAATAASRQTAGFDAKTPVKSKIVVVNPVNGAITGTFIDSKTDRTFNTLLFGKDDLYVTDTAHGEVLRLNDYKGEFQTLVPEGYLDSPAALAESQDGNVLIVSDFISGLYRIDLTKGTLSHLAPPVNGSLLGLAHLSRYGNDLIAVETGFAPYRVIRLHMSPDWSTVQSQEVLLRSDGDLAQPASGLVDGDHFIFIAKSQWDNLDDRGNPLNPTPDPVVVGAIKLGS